MSLFQSPDHILALRDLLQPKNGNEDDSDTDDDGPLILDPEERKKKEQAIADDRNEAAKKSDGKKKSKEKSSPYTPINETACNEGTLVSLPKSLEEWERMEEKDVEILETRKRPEYQLTYRQAVGVEDVYLQMGNRTTATASCENLLLDIILSGDPTPLEKIDLKLTENEIVVSTSVYFLKLPLPATIEVDRTEAKYDSQLEKLTLILHLKREFDFVNF